jgi:hypothetical protein
LPATDDARDDWYDDLEDPELADDEDEDEDRD